MATTSYGTPMVSSTMPNPMTTTTGTTVSTAPMPVRRTMSSRAPLPTAPTVPTQTPTMTSTPMVSTVMPPPTGITANMGLPLSSARPIDVTETTTNLLEIQNFPVVGRAVDGTHFHQDPVTGQMYRMSDELHERIPQILQSRRLVSQATQSTLTTTTPVAPVSDTSILKAPNSTSPNASQYSSVPILNYDVNSIYTRGLRSGMGLNSSKITDEIDQPEINTLLNSSVKNLFDSFILSSDNVSVRSSLGFKYAQSETPLRIAESSVQNNLLLQNGGIYDGTKSILIDNNSLININKSIGDIITRQDDGQKLNLRRSTVNNFLNSNPSIQNLSQLKSNFTKINTFFNEPFKNQYTMSSLMKFTPINRFINF